MTLQPKEILVEGFKIKLGYLTGKDMPNVFSLIEGENWPVSFEDVQCMFQAQPTALIGAFLEDGTLIGSIFALHYSDNLAYIGGFITVPKYRRKGIGTFLFKTALQQLENKNIILDAVFEAQGYYKRYGLQSSEITLRNISMEAKPIPEFEEPGDLKIVPIDEDNVELVMKYDTLISQVDRATFVRLWLNSKVSVSFAAFLNDTCVGYTNARYDDKKRIHRIQPLYADSAEIGTSLMQSLLKSCMECMPTEKNKSIVIELLTATRNLEECITLAVQFGDVKSNTPWTWRMNTKQEVNLAWERVFSVVNCTNTYV